MLLKSRWASCWNVLQTHTCWWCVYVWLAALGCYLIPKETVRSGLHRPVGGGERKSERKTGRIKIKCLTVDVIHGESVGEVGYVGLLSERRLLLRWPFWATVIQALDWQAKQKGECLHAAAFLTQTSTDCSCSVYLCQLVQLSQPGTKHLIQVLVLLVTVLLFLLLLLSDLHLLIWQLIHLRIRRVMLINAAPVISVLHLVVNSVYYTLLKPCLKLAVWKLQIQCKWLTCNKSTGSRNPASKSPAGFSRQDGLWRPWDAHRFLWDFPTIQMHIRSCSEYICSLIISQIGIIKMSQEIVPAPAHL